MRILIDPFDEAEKLSRQGGRWIVAIVETRVSWPRKRQILRFEGREFLLIPQEERKDLLSPLLPAIALKADAYGLSDADARKEILRFATALSWREGDKIELVSWSGGGLPRSMGILRNSMRTDYLDAEHLPSPAGDAPRAALAFFREGISLDNPFYAFLSLYKAFSVAVADAKKRGQWITDHRAALDNDSAKKRLAGIEKDGKEVGAYLYEQCRHAIAHADREPFVNPDNTDDHARLVRDLPLMRNFVEIAIEEAFQVKRRWTIHREHLYELDGFRQLIPAPVLERLKRGDGVEESIELDLPDEPLLVAVRGQQRHPLPAMSIVGGGWIKGGLVLEFRSREGTVRLRMALDFKSEKLHFDPVRGFMIESDRSDQARAREELDALQFNRCILSNGHIEIWDRRNERRLGCSEPFIPTNCFVNTEYFDAEVSALQSILGGTPAT